MPYKTIKDAKDAGFPTKAEGVVLTIDQINKLADIYDAVKKDPQIKVPFSVAWTQWKKIYQKVGDKWIKRASEMFYPIKVGDLVFAEGEYRTDIQVLKIGSWKHPVYGRIKISDKDLNGFVENFENNVRKDLPITEGHSVGNEEKPAIGWFTQLINKGRDGLWAAIDWTKEGKKLLQEKAYKYFSPEFYSVYEDPETHKTYTNVLIGGALTNRPYFKGLQAVVLSEKTFDEPMKTLEEVLKIEVSELTDEDKEVLKEKKEDLTDEQKETYKDTLEETSTEEEKEEKTEEKTEEKEEEKEEEKKEEVEGTENVQISKATLGTLEKNASEGVKAMAILREEKATNYTKSLIFSEENSTGLLLPKSRDKMVAFLLSLNEVQQKEFKEILTEMPRTKLFSELGESSGVEVKASEQASKLAREKMDKDEKLEYRQALDQVFAENSELAERVRQE